MGILKLAVIQFTPVWNDKAANLQRLEAILTGVTADIVVLPELCTTGYFFLSRRETAAAAEPAGGETGRFFRRLSLRLNAVIVAGFVERDCDRIFNSCLIVQPEAEQLSIYRKTHLFYREKDCFDPGDTGFFVLTDDVRGVRIGPMICYDWRFPEAARVLTLLGADLIVCPSNLVTDAWKIVMPARAVENKLYIAVANRAGLEVRETEQLQFKGKSAIYDFTGRILEQAGEHEDAVLTAGIDPAATRDKSFNSINDVLRDRRPAYYRRLTDTSGDESEERRI